MTHVQDRMINVSEILPLRTIKVNKGKFTLEIGPLNGQAHTLAVVTLQTFTWVKPIYLGQIHQKFA